MKKVIFTLYTTLCLCTSLFSQTFDGKLGYGVSPLGYPNDFSQFGTFLQEVANTCNGGVVMANGNWRNDINSAGYIPTLQKTIAQLQPTPYNYTDLLVFAWATYPALYLNTTINPINNWSNSNMRDLFIKTLIHTADSLNPTYIFIGNEVNFYISQDSTDYSNWASFYSMAYDSIKYYSPNTKVGTIFNYEHLSGQGINTGWNTPHWNALSDLDTSKIDIVGITLYPFLNYQKAISVSPDYLDALFAQIGNKPLAITETGWPGDSLIGNWDASPQEQVNWVNKLFTIINGKNVEVVNWLFLNYLMDYSNSTESLIFKSVALRDSLGNDRPALQTWLSKCNATSVESGLKINSNTFIFPNPVVSNSKIISEHYFNNASLNIYNIFGKLILHINNINGREITIQKGRLINGIYLIELIDETVNEKIKFIIE